MLYGEMSLRRVVMWRVVIWQNVIWRNVIWRDVTEPYKFLMIKTGKLFEIAEVYNIRLKKLKV